MKCYCPICGCEYHFKNDMFQVGCHARNHIDECDGNLFDLPDYETPEQYERRTGKPYPDEGAVWRFSRVHWFLCDYGWIKGEAELGRVYLTVIADPPVPPPDDWKPEEK